MKFDTTKVFDKKLKEFESGLLDSIQGILINNPLAGDIITGSGGIRKLRVKLTNTGKSGGSRVIYYLVNKEHIILIYIYKKSNVENLTKEQTKLFKAIATQIKKDNRAKKKD